ncbi:hypothetical protein diail_2784 [Diaporthe ilicicola]|nr:hypothetical protein diail_2784 [Diaporthe ilicicola]
MGTTEVYSQRPHYQQCGHTTCHRDEDRRWFKLHVKVHGTTVTINVNQENFENSPSRLDEFKHYLETLQLEIEGDWFPDEEDGDNDNRGAEFPKQYPALDFSVDDCYEWATSPFLPLQKEIAPRPSDVATITLQHFFSSEYLYASLKAVDNALIPGIIQQRDEMENPIDDPMILWTTTCPVFRAREVEVLSDDTTYILIDEPARVRVQGRELFFKAFPGSRR